MRRSRLWLWLTAGVAIAVLVASRSARAQNVVLDVLGKRLYLSLPGMDKLKRVEARGGVPDLVHYQDDAGWGTIGFGHKILPGESFGSIDEGQATALLAADIRSAEDAVNAGVSVPISQAQFDALVFFALNVGSRAFAKSVTRACLACSGDGIPSPILALQDLRFGRYELEDGGGAPWRLIRLPAF